MAFNIVNFIAGFIGALAPEIVRLYKIRRERLSFPSTYYPITFLYAFVGGYLGAIIADINLFYAFGVGVALPVVISLAGKAVMIEYQWRIESKERMIQYSIDPDGNPPLRLSTPSEPSHIPFSKFIIYLYE